jgi:hypothetical protein
LLVNWTVAFSQETGAGDPGRAARAVADRLSHDGLMLWEAGGVPVAMAIPISNALYKRLAYRPMGDRVELSLAPGKGHRSDVTGALGAPSKTS